MGNTKDEAWYPGKHFIEIVNAAVKASHLAQLVQDNAKTQPEQEIADNILIQVAETSSNLIDTAAQEIKLARLVYRKSDARKPEVDDLVKHKAILDKVQEQLLELTKGEELNNIIVGAEKKEVSKSFLNHARNIVSQIISVLKNALTKLSDMMTNTTQALSDSHYKPKHKKIFKPVMEELVNKSKHKENFKPVLDMLEGKEHNLKSGLKYPAPKGELGTKKYKQVMEDINKAGINEEGTSSNLRGMGKKQ